MTAWKKLAALFVASLSVGICAAACTTSADEPANESSATTIEEALPAEATTTTLADEEEHRHCIRHCYHRYDRCIDERGHHHGCGAERDECIERCHRHHHH